MLHIKFLRFCILYIHLGEMYLHFFSLIKTKKHEQTPAPSRKRLGKVLSLNYNTYNNIQ